MTMSVSRRNPIVFAVGCARSGTTVLQRMLDNHPELAVANDTHFILGAVPRSMLAEGNDPALTGQMVDSTLAYYRFARLGLTEAETRAAAEGAGTYSQFVSRLYSAFCAKSNKPYAGEKTPSYGTGLPILNRLFPGAKFVVLVRDGRDVALSAMEWAVRKGRRRGPARLTLWDQDRLAASALWWGWNVHRALEDTQAIGSDLVVRFSYAEVVADPDRCMADICSLLGLPYSHSMARYYEGKELANGTGSAKQRWLRPTAGLRDWRSQMDKEDREVFAGLVGKILEQAGYESGSNVTTQSASRRVETARSWSLSERPWSDDYIERISAG